MEPSSNFTYLIVWQKAHRFVLETYKYSSLFPREEVYGLTAQYRRAAISAAANIAEGFKKKSNKDKMRFYNISQGSLEECRYYLILTQDLSYSNNHFLVQLLEEVSKMLNALIASINKKL